jgi:DNA relaxase NicK
MNDKIQIIIDIFFSLSHYILLACPIIRDEKKIKKLITPRKLKKKTEKTD